MTLQSAGGQSVAHGHQPAAGLTHQHPFPWIPFAALEPVVTIAGAPAGAAAPGVVALRCANEPVPGATAPDHQQRQEIADCQQPQAGASPLADQAPLLPTEPGEAGFEVCQQSGDALVAEPSTGESGRRTDPLQPAVLNRLVKHAPLTDKRKHFQLQGGALGMDLFQHPQRDQIFPVAVADHQQSGTVVADTIA